MAGTGDDCSYALRGYFMKNVCLCAALAVLACGCASPSLLNPAAKGDIAKVSALLASGTDPNEHRRAYANRTALHLAAAKSQVAVARLLIERGANVNAKAACGSTPLHFAACAGNTEMVHLLLQAGAEPDPSGTGTCSYVTFSDKDRGTPLQLAENNGHTMIAELIRPPFPPSWASRPARLSLRRSTPRWPPRC
jgi:ankyrin repeat protein